jgi:hypothetical protein
MKTVILKRKAGQRSDNGPGQRRWTIFVCEDCRRPGWAFETNEPCNPAEHRHRGAHGGAVEVMPVAEHEEKLGEVERQRDEAETAVANLKGSIEEVAVTSLRYCEERYGHDDQARLNLEAGLQMVERVAGEMETEAAGVSG